MRRGESVRAVGWLLLALDVECFLLLDVVG